MRRVVVVEERYCKEGRKMTLCNTKCNNCGTDLTGLPHHSGERGWPLCHDCVHPGQPCPAEHLPDSSLVTKPSNAEPDPEALNKQGKKSSKKNKPTMIPSEGETSLAPQSTKAGVGASGQAEVLTPPGKPPPEGESGKGTILQGEDGYKISPAEKKERSIMAEEKKTRKRRRKCLLDWQPTAWEAGHWTLKKLMRGSLELSDIHDAGDSLVKKFTSVEEAQDYAEAIEGVRRKYAAVKAVC